MFEIWNGDTLECVAEQVNFIRLHSNGRYVICPECDAQGIAVAGEPFNLQGRVPMPGLSTVKLVEAVPVTFGQLKTTALARITELESMVNRLKALLGAAGLLNEEAIM